MAEKIERKISRVVSWLERCASSCKGESYGSALMDIESARVDFDSARDEIWNAAREYHDRRPRGRRFLRLARAALVSFAVLLASSSPLSVAEEIFTAGPPVSALPDDGGSAGESGSVLKSRAIEWAKPDKTALLENVRERLSAAGALASVPSAPAAVTGGSVGAAAGSAVELPRNDEERGKNGDIDDIEKETRIFTLLKIGQDALRSKSGAVLIER